ncbi:MAG: hypothetical protein OHK006_15540 [Thermodesulfovibrionales bacterium]
MKIGIIGERNNPIAHAILTNSLKCAGVEIVWFAAGDSPRETREMHHGSEFDYGLMMTVLGRIYSWLSRTKADSSRYDCQAVCDSRDIPFIVPAGSSINSGLPEHMYADPEADYVVIAGCDQLLDENGLRLARRAVINYHYSPLPAYRGKNALFWQWYYKEPFIGYTFHRVDLGIDTGEIIFQGKTGYDANEPVSEVERRVIAQSTGEVCKVYECLEHGRKVLIPEALASSYFPSRKFLDLITADSSRTVSEILAVFDMLGYFRLRNGLYIAKIIRHGSRQSAEYSIDQEGITIPLSDGHVKGVPFLSRVPFWVYAVLIGRKRMLRGLA